MISYKKLPFRARAVFWTGIVMYSLLGFSVLHTSSAEALIENAFASPLSIYTNEPTDILITAEITDPRVIEGGVNLLRVDANGKVISILGNLNDTGVNGDIAAGDHIFSLRHTFTEPIPTPVNLRVSWALRGVLRRSLSNIFSIEVIDKIPPGEEPVTF